MQIKRRPQIYDTESQKARMWVAMLVERQTRYAMLINLASKYTETVINLLIRHAWKLPDELYQSLTSIHQLHG